MADSIQHLDLLLQAAKQIDAKISNASDKLVSSNFNSEILSNAVTGTTISRNEKNLPNLVHGVRIDDIPVLIGELTGPALRVKVEQELRRYRNQASIARSWLGVEAPNLQLFLIGPKGAFAQSEWRQIAAEIETDDRICRKVVWLYDTAPTIEDAKYFLGRTFVARPWPTSKEKVQLDTVASFTLPKGWEKAADDPAHDFNGLIESLIDLETKL